MSFCINPSCPNPQNTRKPLFCLACGSNLLLQDSYRVLKFLGGGGFGKTYEIDDCGNLKVLKVLHNVSPKAVELFQQEAEVLKRLNHPGIPKVEIDAYFTYTPRNSPTSLHCLVMEKVEGMDLEHYLQQRNNKPISERAAIRWLKQLAAILHEVHSHHYFHRDIKPSNIMLRTDGQLTLIDFGTAREMTQTFMQRVERQKVTGIISPGFTPGEQINGKAVPQSDFFALGRTFVYLLTGKNPNDFPESYQTGELIWRDSAQGTSASLLDLVDYLMKPFPGNRPQTAQEILERVTAIESQRNTSGSSSSSGEIPETEVTERNEVNTFPRNNKAGEYAGFWKRLFAYIIDAVILTIVGTIAVGLFVPFLAFDEYWEVYVFAEKLGLAMGFLLVEKVSGIFLVLIALIDALAGGYGSTEVFFIAVIGFLIKWFYFTRLESSQMQATLGKRALGLMVTDKRGNRPSFSLANIRFWSKSLSALLLLLGFFMAGWTKRKQALHDNIAGTLVVQK